MGEMPYKLLTKNILVSVFG